METNLSLVSPKPVLTLTYNSPNPRILSTKQCLGTPILPKKPSGSVLVSRPRSKNVIFAASNPNSSVSNNGKRVNGVKLFASTSNSADSKRTGQETTSIGVNPQPYFASPPPSQIGSPLFWIAVGVGCSALFSYVKNYAVQQAQKTMMAQMGLGNNPFGGSAFPSGSPFGFPQPSSSGPSTTPGFPYQTTFTAGPNTSAAFPYQPPSTSGAHTSTASSSESSPTVGSNTSTVSASSSRTDQATYATKAPDSVIGEDEPQVKTEAKQSAFVDVSPEETLLQTPFEDLNDSSSQKSSGDVSHAEVVPNGAAFKEASTSEEGKRGSALSVEALEKLMEDPTMQKMIYPHLPEEMRNPETFKWMLQNPVYRQQLQAMLDNMGGSGQWDNRMMDTLKNFNFDNPEVRQQFNQLGLTPEDMVSKIMANPDIAMAFQNPRIQQALLDISQNPMNMAKYQNDAEVMAVFNKITQLFPGASGGGGF